MIREWVSGLMLLREGAGGERCDRAPVLKAPVGLNGAVAAPAEGGETQPLGAAAESWHVCRKGQQPAFHSLRKQSTSRVSTTPSPLKSARQSSPPMSNSMP